MSEQFWLSDEQFERLVPHLPRSRGKVRVDDRRVLQDPFYMSLAESRFQHCPTQTAVLEFALQSLIERLIAAGTLRDDDLAAMRADGLRFARDLTSDGTTVVPPPPARS